MLIAAETLILGLTGLEWGFVALASLVIFAILGRKLAGDVRGWLDKGQR